MSEAPQTSGRPFRYETIAVSDESTVVAEFVADASSVQDAAYQSEDALERAFIRQLQAQAYDYLPLTSEAALIANPPCPFAHRSSPITSCVLRTGRSSRCSSGI